MFSRLSATSKAAFAAAADDAAFDAFLVTYFRTAIGRRRSEAAGFQASHYNVSVVTEINYNSTFQHNIALCMLETSKLQLH